MTLKLDEVIDVEWYLYRDLLAVAYVTCELSIFTYMKKWVEVFHRLYIWELLKNKFFVVENFKIY